MATDLAAELANQLQLKENQERQKIALLLDNYLGKDDRIFVQKTQMGSTEAYIGSVTLEWLDARVRFASQMPLFRDNDTIDEILQHPLDRLRQAALTQYLIARKSHKFPAILVAVSPPWVDEPQAAEWDKCGIATKSAAEFTAFDKNENLGLLNVSREVGIYALDGQHRLMGVQGLMSLIKTGILQRYNKNNKAVGAAIAIEDLAAEYQIDPAQVQKLAREKIGIEFVPAVVAGETRHSALSRMRSIFFHVNLKAVALSQGQLALLNEDNGFAIVARKTAATHPLLKERDDRSPRVNWDSATVAAKATVLTTLQALQDMAGRYLEHKFPHWKPEKKGLIPLRPEDGELGEGIAEFSKLFDCLAALPSYQRIESDEETIRLRQFCFEDPGGEGNILFRPVGQIALADAAGILAFRKQLLLESIFDKLRRFDADGGFSRADNPESAWYGILYDPNKKRVLLSVDCV